MFFAEKKRERCVIQNMIMKIYAILNINLNQSQIFFFRRKNYLFLEKRLVEMYVCRTENINEHKIANINDSQFTRVITIVK